MKDKVRIFTIITSFFLIIVLVSVYLVRNKTSSSDVVELAKQYTYFSEKQAMRFIKKYQVEKWPIARIEKLLYLNENPHLSVNELLEEAIRDRLNNYLLKLQVHNQIYTPAAIFISPRLENEYRLEHDDTAHILEFPETYQPIIISDTDQISISLYHEYTDLPLKFYIGDLRKISYEGYQGIRELEYFNNKLEIHPIDTDSEQLIFTIIKDENEYLNKKLVWVVKKC